MAQMCVAAAVLILVGFATVGDGSRTSAPRRVAQKTNADTDTGAELGVPKKMDSPRSNIDKKASVGMELVQPGPSTNFTTNKTTGGTLAQIGPPILFPAESWSAHISNVGRHLFAGLSFAVMVKVACTVGNLLVQVSPIPQVQDWEGKGSTGNAESAPYVSMGLGGWQWCTYGIAAYLISKNEGFLVLVYANCFGFVLGSYYTFTFYRHCNNTGTGNNLRQYLTAVGCLVFMQTLMWLILPHERALIIHSCIAGACSFVSAASLLASLPEVLRSGDTSGICGPLVVAYFFGAFLWAYWGMLMNDHVVIAANSFAAFTSAICLYVKFVHETKGKDKEFERAKLGNSWSTYAKNQAQGGC